MRKSVCQAVLFATGMLLQGFMGLDAALVHEGGGWWRSTDAVEHVWVVNISAPEANVRPVYMINAEFETLGGLGSAVLCVGNDDALPAMTWGVCGRGVTFATRGDFVEDVAELGVGVIALRATLVPGAERARLVEEITVDGQTRRETREVAISLADAYCPGAVTLRVSGEMRFRWEVVSRRVGSIFMVR